MVYQPLAVKTKLYYFSVIIRIVALVDQDSFVAKATILASFRILLNSWLKLRTHRASLRFGYVKITGDQLMTESSAVHQAGNRLKIHGVT